jgi:hypothetical protein
MKILKMQIIESKVHKIHHALEQRLKIIKAIVQRAFQKVLRLHSSRLSTSFECSVIYES